VLVAVTPDPDRPASPTDPQGVCLEREAEGRWMARQGGLRLGLVLGGHGRFLAYSHADTLMGRARTLRAAAQLLGDRS
jgi:hypothetical protein